MCVTTRACTACARWCSVNPASTVPGNLALKIRVGLRGSRSPQSLVSRSLSTETANREETCSGSTIWKAFTRGCTNTPIRRQEKFITSAAARRMYYLCSSWKRNGDAHGYGGGPPISLSGVRVIRRYLFATFGSFRKPFTGSRPFHREKGLTVSSLGRWTIRNSSTVFFPRVRCEATIEDLDNHPDAQSSRVVEARYGERPLSAR